MDTEDKIRSLMREFDIRCPSCGTDRIGVNKERDSDCGIMDEAMCCDCCHEFLIFSSVHTQLVSK
jgi:ribosomal protein S27E